MLLFWFVLSYGCKTAYDADWQNGIISRFAGTGIAGYYGDEGPANQATTSDVYGLAIDKKDNLYLIDSLNFAVRKVDARANIISTIVGKGMPSPAVEFSPVWDSFLASRLHPKRDDRV